MKNKIILLLALLHMTCFGQIIGVDTLLKSGPISKRINLVIMGDGYTSTQITQFISDATTSYSYLLNTSPFNNYKQYFNVFAIKAASPQSGVTHPGTATDVTEPQSPVMTVTNNFNTRFDNYNIHRLIYSMNSTAVYSVLAAAFPSYDQVIILGNSPEYGGAGGAYAVSSTHVSSPEIVAHEMGHSFAGLADEYWAGISYAAEKPNMTAGSNTATVKWAPWLSLNNIGIYPYDTAAPANAWFRPHQNCKMRYLNVPFCSVCKQTIIEKIHSLVNPIDEYFPDNSGTILPANDSLWFKGMFVKPNPNTLQRTWFFNSGILASNKDSVLLMDYQLSQGSNMVMLTVCDTTQLSKDTNHVNLHTYSVIWSINYSTVGIKEVKTKMELSVFPNPAKDVLNVSYKLMSDTRVGISVVDMSGRVVLSEKPARSREGSYEHKLDIGSLKDGNYILRIQADEQLINQPFIIAK